MAIAQFLASPRQLRQRLLRLLERRPVGQELELAGQPLERQQSGSPSQVFSFSPTTGEFLLIKFHPPANHPAHLSKWSRQDCQFVGINRFYLPQEFDKKLEHIKSSIQLPYRAFFFQL